MHLHVMNISEHGATTISQTEQLQLSGTMVWYRVVMATGLSHPGMSREGPGKVLGRDGTGQDLENLKVPWSCGPRTKEVQKSRDYFLKVPGLPGPFSWTGFC